MNFEFSRTKQERSTYSKVVQEGEHFSSVGYRLQTYGSQENKQTTESKPQVKGGL